jgi:hypothetical protein
MIFLQPKATAPALLDRAEHLPPVECGIIPGKAHPPMDPIRQMCSYAHEDRRLMMKLPNISVPYVERN